MGDALARREGGGIQKDAESEECYRFVRNRYSHRLSRSIEEINVDDRLRILSFFRHPMI